MREITERISLLDQNGALARPGWARHLYYDYDPKAIKASPFAIKEWDFYQISDDRRVLQLTIGHVSYMASVSANLFDLQTGEKLSCGVMKPLPFLGLGMETDGERPHILRFDKPDFKMCFEAGETSRRLTLTAHDKKLGAVDIDILLTNCSPKKDKLVIATPFSKPNQFYLNYKENCCRASGHAKMGDKSVEFSDGAYGLLDWGRGVWPFRHEWIWGSGSTEVNGVPFGFNIGWGFGDTSAATENIFFYNNVGYKLGEVTAQPLGDGGYMSPVRYRDGEGRFDFTVEPIFDHDTATKLLFVDNRCHQVFGRWRGKAVLDDGTVIEPPEFVAFCEHACNRW